ncbi:hypothetical protein Tco_0976519 [Tanacetum coccineum]|uniref:DUF4283 domain-containing protein n=1 Tax=Tanacetum coccineum TaxID=301880 RepID=A0ABQ5EHX6_9ASTR
MGALCRGKGETLSFNAKERELKLLGCRGEKKENTRTYCCQESLLGFTLSCLVSVLGDCGRAFQSLRFDCVGIERGFLSQKGSGGGGRGVKEKQHGLSTVLGTRTGLVNECGYGGNGDGNGGDHSSGNRGTPKPTANVAATATNSPIVLTSPAPTSYAKLFTESIRAISEQFVNKAFGFFLGKREAYLVVANYVRNTWGTIEELDTMLENSPWFICKNPLILKKWNPDVNLLKEDVGNIPVWVKLHGVPVTAFSEDGLSANATKIGTPLMLDSYTSDMCIQSRDRSSYARALIEVRADVELKDNIVVAMLKIVGKGFYTCNVHVEYEWKPYRYTCCKVFSHVQDECPKNKVSDVVSKKNNVSTSGNKKTDAKPIKEVSKSNSFDVLNSVENDVDLRINGGTSNLTNKKANSSGSSFGNAKSSSTSTTPIVEKIDKMERLIIDETATLVDDEGILLTGVDSLSDHDSDDEVASVDNDMAKFFASKDVGYGQEVVSFVVLYLCVPSFKEVGEYMWEKFYNRTVNVVSRHTEHHLAQLKKNPNFNATYNLYGFAWAFKIWILESYPNSKKWWSKKANVIPRGLAWSKVTMFEKSDYEELFGPMSNPNVPLIASPEEMSHAWFKDSAEVVGKICPKMNRISVDDGDGVFDSQPDDGDGVLDSQTKDVIEETSMLPTMSSNSPQAGNAAVSEFFS